MMSELSENTIILEELLNFYKTSLNYIETWTAPFMLFETETFEWIFLKTEITWQNVEKGLKIMFEYVEPGAVNDSELFDEVQIINSYLTDNLLQNWEKTNVLVNLR